MRRIIRPGRSRPVPAGDPMRPAILRRRGIAYELISLPITDRYA
jgi:hypothetical protein